MQKLLNLPLRHTFYSVRNLGGQSQNVTAATNREG